MTKKTRYFMGGSAAILVAGLGTGLVAYYGGGFPSLSASRSGPSELSYVPADAAVVAFANVREVMDSQLRQRLKAVLPAGTGPEGIPAGDRHRHRARHRLRRRRDDQRAGTGVQRAAQRPGRRARPLQHDPARDPRARARRRRRGIQGQAPGQGVRRQVTPRRRRSDGTTVNKPAHTVMPRVPRARPRRHRQRRRRSRAPSTRSSPPTASPATTT